MTMNVQLNPLLTIWLRPRATLRRILDYDPGLLVMDLAKFSGISFFFQIIEIQFNEVGSLFLELFLILILGWLFGVVSISIAGAIFHWTGSWLGGQGSAKELRAGIAWSSIPIMLLLIIEIPRKILIDMHWIEALPGWLNFGQEINLMNVPIQVNALLLVVSILLLGWQGLLFVKCLAEAHRFSAWKGLAASVLGLSIIAVPIGTFVFLLYRHRV
jgi:hypothetical protein